MLLLSGQLKLTTTKYTNKRKTDARFKDLGSADSQLFGFRIFRFFRGCEKFQRVTVLAGLFRVRITFPLDRRGRPAGSTVPTSSGLRPEGTTNTPRKYASLGTKGDCAARSTYSECRVPPAYSLQAPYKYISQARTLNSNALLFSTPLSKIAKFILPMFDS